jgi:hypothetical protein
MIDRELFTQALEALELLVNLPTEEALDYADNAIDALRERLAQPEQEPVAWVREHEFPLAPGDAFSWIKTLLHKTPLYTTPPQRKPDHFVGASKMYHIDSLEQAIEAVQNIKEQS